MRALSLFKGVLLLVTCWRCCAESHEGAHQANNPTNRHLAFSKLSIKRRRQTKNWDLNKCITDAHDDNKKRILLISHTAPYFLLLPRYYSDPSRRNVSGRMTAGIWRDCSFVQRKPCFPLFCSSSLSLSFPTWCVCVLCVAAATQQSTRTTKKKSFIQRMFFFFFVSYFLHWLPSGPHTWYESV